MSAAERFVVSQELIESVSCEAQAVISPFMRQQIAEDRTELKEAEVRSHITKLLRSYYTPVASNRDNYVLDEMDTELPTPQHIGSQFGRRLQTVFMQPDIERGLEQFRVIRGDTDDQRKVLESSDEQVKSVWGRVHRFIADRKVFLGKIVDTRFLTDSLNGHENRSAFSNNDRYQFNGRETARSLSGVMKSGLSVGVDPQGIMILEQAERARAAEGAPIMELVKNWPILSISGFAGSKLSLAAHDAIDHVWSFELANERGLFVKYQKLFQSIGNPHLTDIFKREGEIIASISFGARYWERQLGFVPIIQTSTIEAHLTNLATSGQLHERHEKAVEAVRNMVPGTEEYDKLGFVFSNYLVTLHEQRRRYGQIKQRDPETGKLIGELNPFSPDFLCFLIELHHEIEAAGHNRRNAITIVHASLEEYLQTVAQHRSGSGHPLTLHPFSAKGAIKIPPTDMDWLTTNHQFSTIKERVHHD